MATEVRAAPACWLRSTTEAHPDGAGCLVVEVTEVTAPWPLLGYMARTAEQAHARTFTLLPEALA